MTELDGGNTPRRDGEVRSALQVTQERDASLQRAVLGYAAAPDSPLPTLDIEVRTHAVTRAFKFKPAEHITRLVALHPEAFEAMAMLGAHPSRGFQIHNYYTNTPSQDRFQNIGEHGVAATVVASALGRDLLSPEELKELSDTCLTDPLSKVGEALRREAARAGQYEEAKIYLPEAYAEERDILLSKGLHPDTVGRIFAKDVVTGHRSFASFVTLNEQGNPQVVINDKNINRAILHLADDMLYSTLPAIAKTYKEAPVTAIIEPVERMLARMFHSTEKVDGKALGYPWMWKDGLGVNPDGKIVQDVNQERPQPGVRAIGHYAYFQRFIAEQIAEVFVQRLQDKGVLPSKSQGSPLEQIRDYVISGIKAHPK